MRRLYQWVLHWAYTPYASVALFLNAFTESSFFPVPPDVLLIALSVAHSKKALYYSTICVIGSVFGAVLGYIIGYGFYETVGVIIINTLNLQEAYEKVDALYSQNAFIAILGAAFTPIPYKVFTIAAGVWKIPITTLIIASILGRGGRFFLLGFLLYIFGPKIKGFIDKYFEVVMLLAFLLVVAGFVIIKWVM